MQKLIRLCNTWPVKFRKCKCKTVTKKQKNTPMINYWFKSLNYKKKEEKNGKELNGDLIFIW